MKKLIFLLFITQTISAQIIHLSGTPYERGVQHGKQLKPQIAEVFTKWKASLHQDSGKDASEVIKTFLESTRFLNSIQTWTPDIYEEIKGIADGSGQSLEDVFAFNLIDEYWAHLDRVKNENQEKNKCTAVGVAKSSDQPTIVAQNVDIDNYMQGYQVLLHIQGDKQTPEQYIMSCAGFLGFAGMNKNLSLVINALTDVNSSVEGLPVTFVFRGILSKKTAQEALDFVHYVQHATGQNYLIGTNKEVYTFEASANRVEEFNPHKRKLVYHTNHSLVNEDIKPWRVETRKKMLDGSRKANSNTRLAGVHKFLEKFENKLTAENIKDILRSKEDPIFPICVPYREGGGAFTFSSVVFTLGKDPSAEVTYGEPDKNDYQKHYFKK
ncbi:C45 family autoproteolytic acyltransferase/hydolase [Leadbetterella byssophila]|uniref:C45 family autoproteolytic acyltransferase/hydolase n=1 Tax=Leadbetterella byssophila TaxID=316068 RepID=UPI0039A3686F